MNLDTLYSELTLKTKAKLVLVVLDGLGDLATISQNEVTPLEAAHTPNLDQLVARGVAQGRMTPVAPGITPGSGPGHLGLFGYDPLSDAITDFVQITDNGTHSYLSIDADGGADNFIQVAAIFNQTGLTDEELLVTNGILIAA